MQKNIRMKDIADKLHISVVTVSKALNEKEGVGSELREEIKKVADEMGYYVHRAAKGMKEGLCYSIGVIICEKFLKNNANSNSFYFDCYSLISNELSAKEYTTVLHSLSEYDEKNLVLPRIYKENVVDGFIFLGQVSEDYIAFFQQQEIPFVLCDFYTSRVEADYVITDNYFSGLLLGNYLLDKGYTTFRYVGSLAATNSIQDRYLGFGKALIQRGFSFSTDDVIPDRDEKGIYIDLVLPKELPQVFVCNCDQVAFNLIQKLKEQQIAVPEQCGVVGFDNDWYATLLKPHLTTVQVDTKEMAKESAKMIIKKLHRSSTTKMKVMIQGKLMIRDSV